MIYIAIVEDQEGIVRSLERAISDVPDYEITGVFYNGEAAVAELNQKKVDVVIMDIGLPRMNGVECMVRLKRQEPSLMFLMFTIFDTDEDLYQALRFGADGYILKTDNRRAIIIPAIRDILNGGAPMTPSIAKKMLLSFRKPATRQQIPDLTPRQNDILELMADGKTDQEIADLINISSGTVRQQNHKIYKKLQVGNRTEAANYYNQLPPI